MLFEENHIITVDQLIMEQIHQEYAPGHTYSQELASETRFQDIINQWIQNNSGTA
jgi:hypothetical protein